MRNIYLEYTWQGVYPQHLLNELMSVEKPLKEKLAYFLTGIKMLAYYKTSFKLNHQIIIIWARKMTVDNCAK